MVVFLQSSHWESDWVNIQLVSVDVTYIIHFYVTSKLALILNPQYINDT